MPKTKDLPTFGFTGSGFASYPVALGFNQDLIGPHGLLAAMLYRALCDLESTSLHYRTDARRWFLAVDMRRPFGFEWTCEHLNMNPERILRALWENGLLREDQWQERQD